MKGEVRRERKETTEKERKDGEEVWKGRSGKERKIRGSGSTKH